MNELCEYWAIIDRYLKAIEHVSNSVDFTRAISIRGAGDVKMDIAANEVFAKRQEPRALKSAGGSIGVIPVYGLLMQRSGWLLDWLGGTSMEDFNRDFDTFVNESDVKAIVLDVDSGGGSVFGIEETAKKILAARERKPVYAIANSTAASAAFWLAASASKIFATPGAEVGSIGTLAIHVDQSGSDTMLGVRRTIIKQGSAKALANAYGPLTAEGRDEIQSHVNRYYDMFVRSVAKGRGTTPNQVEKNYGQGRVFGPQEAKEVGMIDGIATFDEVLGSLQSKKGARGSRTRAEDELVIGEDVAPAESEPELTPEAPEAEDVPKEQEKPSGRDTRGLRRRLKLATIK